MPLSAQKTRPCHSACDTALRNVSRIALDMLSLDYTGLRLSLALLCTEWGAELAELFLLHCWFVVRFFFSPTCLFSAKALLTLGHSRVVGRALPPLLRQQLQGFRTTWQAVGWAVRLLTDSIALSNKAAALGYISAKEWFRFSCF